jgi:DNA-damage-inducible protein D
MKDKNELAIFDGFRIRRHYNEKTEIWFFSVVDIIAVLTESINPTDYLKKLRKRDSELADYIGTNCPHIEMVTDTGKNRKTLAGNPEHILRIIQSVPSKKAEPIKLWLAKVGYERIQEIADPEKGLNRARENWKKHGRSQKWIQQRMMGQETRNKLTDYWSENGVAERNEFAILTNIIHEEWSDVTVGQHKKLKGLKNQNLRDHMSEAELVFTALAELSTRNTAEKDSAIGFPENAVAAKKGGGVAKRARKDFEQLTGRKVVSRENFIKPKKISKFLNNK